MAVRARNYIESIHEEVVGKYNEPGWESDEWLEYTLLETETLISEIDSMIEKYNCQCVAHTDLFYGGEVETVYHNYLRVIK